MIILLAIRINAIAELPKTEYLKEWKRYGLENNWFIFFMPTFHEQKSAVERPILFSSIISQNMSKRYDVLEKELIHVFLENFSLKKKILLKDHIFFYNNFSFFILEVEESNWAGLLQKLLVILFLSWKWGAFMI